jgi:hypothetical protein
MQKDDDVLLKKYYNYLNDILFQYYNGTDGYFDNEIRGTNQTVGNHFTNESYNWKNTNLVYNACIEKLKTDGYINTDPKNDKDFTITYKGVLFYLEGGYIKEYEKDKTNKYIKDKIEELTVWSLQDKKKVLNTDTQRAILSVIVGALLGCISALGIEEYRKTKQIPLPVPLKVQIMPSKVFCPYLDSVSHATLQKK